jgi:hypothetical protein
MNDKLRNTLPDEENINGFFDSTGAFGYGNRSSR